MFQDTSRILPQPLEPYNQASNASYSYIVYAYKEIQSVISTLKGIRERSSSEFNNIFSEAQKLRKDLHGQDFELSRSRIVRHQMHRSNPETSSPEVHYHFTLYNEFLSQVIRELLERFTENSSHGAAISYQVNLYPLRWKMRFQKSLLKQ